MAIESENEPMYDPYGGYGDSDDNEEALLASLSPILDPFTCDCCLPGFHTSHMEEIDLNEPGDSASRQTTNEDLSSVDGTGESADSQLTHGSTPTPKDSSIGPAPEEETRIFNHICGCLVDLALSASPLASKRDSLAATHTEYR
jgi:hypothetical protein